MAIHLILDLFNCNPIILNKKSILLDLITEVALLYEMEILNTSIHQFAPHGVTALHLLGESHISIHTWPEKNYAAVDFFTCRKVDFKAAVEKFKEVLNSEDVKLQIIERN